MRNSKAMPLVRVLLGVALGLLAMHSVSVGAHIRESEEVDLGDVARGARIEHTFEIVNSGILGLTIDAIESSCGVASSIKQGQVVPARSALKFVVTADTAGAVEGPRYSTLILRTSAPIRGTHTLTLKHQVRSEFTLSSQFIKLSFDRASAAIDFKPAAGLSLHVTAVRATDPRVTAGFSRKNDLTRITAAIPPDHARSWDLGLLLVSTSSAIYPEFRIPVRGTLDPKLP